jgi:hypothetical protein
MASGLTHPPRRAETRHATGRPHSRASLVASRISQANDASRDTIHVLESDARTPLADFFSILLARPNHQPHKTWPTA